MRNISKLINTLRVKVPCTTS